MCHGTASTPISADRTRLEQETRETLYAYARFLGESTEYVLNQVIDSVLAKDKDFVQWRTEHPDSCAPRVQGRPDGARRVATTDRHAPQESPVIRSASSARP